jgi:hypothetical protein
MELLLVIESWKIDSRSKAVNGDILVEVVVQQNGGDLGKGFLVLVWLRWIDVVERVRAFLIAI